MATKNDKMDPENLNILLHDCLVRVLPLFPIATMKKVSLLVSNPSRMASIKLTPDEVELVSTSLRKEMEKLASISESVSNSIERNSIQARVKDLEISNTVSTAIQHAEDVREVLQTVKSIKSSQANEIIKQLFSTEEVIKTKTASVGEKIASLQGDLECLSQVSEKLDTLMEQQTMKVNEEIARVEQEIMQYEAIPNFENYLKEYNSIVKAIEELEKLKK